jgi:DUF4097 and DUF4098 domain-containing protein YvlB/polyhydroxyalkanoate synthesis regulator phasin
MSEEALLIMKMVREGKITPEQGVAFLEALKHNAPPSQGHGGPTADAGSDGNGTWRSVSNMQHVLAQLQQQLAEMQAKLGAAQAGGAAPTPSSRVKLPFGMGDFDIGQILDETMKGVNALKTDFVISSKKAARQAQREARKFRSQAERLGKNIHVEVHVRTETEDRPANVKGYPEATGRVERTIDFPSDCQLAVSNWFGDVKVIGVSEDEKIHASADITVWAASAAEREETIRAIRIDESIGDGGRGVAINIGAPAELPDGSISVNLTVLTPIAAAVQAKTTFGDIHCESIEGGVSRAESISGAIRLLHVHSEAESGAPEAEARVETRSGEISISQWRGAPLSIESLSGEIQLDVIEAPRLTMQSKSGEATVRALTVPGDFRIDTTSADQRIGDCEIGGLCAVKTLSGDVEMANLKLRGLTVDTVSGDVEFKAGVDVNGRAVIKSISGDLDIKDLAASEVGVNSTSGDVDLGLSGAFTGSISASTVSGDLSVALPLAYSGRLTMATNSGSLKCEPTMTSPEGDSEKYLTGIVGDPAAAGATVMLQSVSGDLTVERAE